MTQQELNGQLAGLEKQLRLLGIPLSSNIHPQVAVNRRAQRRLGCCIGKDGNFTIEVSARILDHPELLRVTLVHELLHTCYGCQNHGKRWKGYAAKAGAALGMEIRTTVALEGEPQRLREEPVKAYLHCRSCGRLIPRRRLSKALKHPERYLCPCGGVLEVLPVPPEEEKT